MNRYSQGEMLPNGLFRVVCQWDDCYNPQTDSSLWGYINVTVLRSLYLTYKQAH